MSDMFLDSNGWTLDVDHPGVVSSGNGQLKASWDGRLGGFVIFRATDFSAWMRGGDIMTTDAFPVMTDIPGISAELASQAIGALLGYEVMLARRSGRTLDMNAISGIVPPEMVRLVLEPPSSVLLQ